MMEIGGYFELEFPKGDMSLVPHGLFVNSGRHALEYILRSLGERVKRVLLPYYTCDVVLEPIKRLNLNYRFYHINPNLEIADTPDLKDGDYLIINNYFGIKDKYIEEMSKNFGEKLIIDNAQAWYCPPQTSSNYFYSPRKFFGLPDGGVVGCPIEYKLELAEGFSANRCSHLLKRIDSGATSGYQDFKSNSIQLKDEPLTRMSKLTERMLSTVDFEWTKIRRRSNFEILHSAMGSTNQLVLPSMDEFACPMVYPYMSGQLDLRKKLIYNKIFVATYWPNVLQWCNEYSLEFIFTRQIIPIPIDQRYGSEEMSYIINIIKKG